MSPLETYKIRLFQPIFLILVGVLVLIIVLGLLGIAFGIIDVNYTGSNSELFITAFPFSIIGILFLKKGVDWLTLPTYNLYESKIEIGKNNIATNLAEIEHLYLFATGRNNGFIATLPSGYDSLAFRKNSEDSWKPIFNKYGGNIDVFIDQYLEVRTPIVIRTMVQTPVEFLYISNRQSWMKKIFAIGFKDFLNIKTKTLKLSKNDIELEGKSYNLNDLRPIYVNKDDFEIHTKDGNKIFSFKYQNMISSGVFIDVFNQMVFNQNK